MERSSYVWCGNARKLESGKSNVRLGQKSEWLKSPPVGRLSLQHSSLQAIGFPATGQAFEEARRRGKPANRHRRTVDTLNALMLWFGH